LDYLVTTLGFVQAAARQGQAGLKHTPPDIVWATNLTVLVVIDGQPDLRQIPDSSLQRVVNTPAFLLYDKASGKFYLSGENQWFAATTLEGPWSLIQDLPGEVAKLSTVPADNSAAHVPGSVPRIIVKTKPTELLVTGGLPDFRPISGTALQYAADSDNQLFF